MPLTFIDEEVALKKPQFRKGIGVKFEEIDYLE
jgi:hypothetical protein